MEEDYIFALSNPWNIWLGFVIIVDSFSFFKKYFNSNGSIRVIEIHVIEIHVIEIRVIENRVIEIRVIEIRVIKIRI